MPHVETKIVDPATGEPVRRGATGELCTRGYSVMSGYWEEPERTAAVIDEDGWMHSGDLASMDEDGYVRIEGRIKDVISRGGEKFSTEEVEKLLLQHPAVHEAAVVAMPEPRGFVSISTSPGFAPAFVSTFFGWTWPVTASP